MFEFFLFTSLLAVKGRTFGVKGSLLPKLGMLSLDVLRLGVS